LTDELAELMFTFCRLDLLELFTVSLKRNLKGELEFLQLIDVIFPALKADMKEEVLIIINSI
jgi:hypothetical protein